MVLALASFIDSLEQIDKEILLTVNGCHSLFWDGWMYLYSNKWVWIPFYVALFYVILRNCSWRTVLIVAVALALLIVLSDQASAKLIRSMVDRYRPSHDDELAPLVHTVMGWKGGHWSFPSAHAANAWALVTFLSLLLRRRWFMWMMVGWGVVMCYSRMYLGLHFLGDLLVGGAVGALVAVFVWIAFRYIGRQQAVANPRGLWVPASVLALTLITFATLSVLHVIPV